MFKRKVYNDLLNWKEKYSGKYAALLEGARRVGKSTIALEFAKNEYKSYIMIDFGQVGNNIKDLFLDISNLDLFFLRLQAEFGISLTNRESVIIFDEIQLFPLARQAIKYLVKDGRYDYIETGSLISIKKNVEKILIPSEEYKINVYPMDMEEFFWAIGRTDYDVLRNLYLLNKPIGESTNRKLLRDFRIYLAVGGMPQAVEAYVEKKSFLDIDFIKRAIIKLYKDDFMKIDSTGRIGRIYDSIPATLALQRKRFFISSATNSRNKKKNDQLLSEIIDSKTVLICYNTTNPNASLSQTKDLTDYKLYLSDVGLFTTMLFNDKDKNYEDIYKKLLSDKLDINLGFLYENAVAQIIKSTDRELYFHTWKKKDSTHSYEIDFLLSNKGKIIPIEVKSGLIKNHHSIDDFMIKYSSRINKSIVLSGHDVNHENMLLFKPIYFLPFILEE